MKRFIFCALMIVIGECAYSQISAFYDPPFPNEETEPSLHHAVRTLDQQQAANLIRDGAGVNERGINSETPLHIAAERSFALTRLLLQNDADVNALNGEKQNPLVMAAMWESYVPFQPPAHGFEVVDDPAEKLKVSEQRKIIELLLKSGANVDQVSKDGRTALHYLAALGATDSVKLLLERGANPNLKDRSQQTPIFYAAFWNRYDAAKLLVEAGAELNLINREKQSLISFCGKDNQPLTELLILNGVDSEIPPNYKHTLHHAAQTNDIEKIKYFLDNGAKLEAKSSIDQTPLDAAVHFQRLEAARLLIAKGASVNRLSSFPDWNGKIYWNNEYTMGLSPLHFAAQEGNVALIEELLSAKADIQLRSQYRDQTALDLAVQKGQPEAVELLLKNGAAVNAANKLSLAPIHELFPYAAILKKPDNPAPEVKLRILKILIQHGADVNLQEPLLQYSPLLLALNFGEDQLARTLIENGADLRLQDKNAQRPIDFALCNDKLELARLIAERDPDFAQDWPPLYRAIWSADNERLIRLLDDGADVNALAENQRSALALAVMLKRAKQVELLIQHGANVEAGDDIKRTPLMIAASNGALDCCRWLLQAGANQQAENFKGEIPIIFAVRNGRLEIVKLLIESGADVNYYSERCWTPLCWAARTGSVEMAKLLLNNGADIQLTGAARFTPLEIARRYKQEQVAEFLETYKQE